MTTETADVIVVGLGAMGSAALYQLARRGVRAIGVDRFSPPHGEGSSHGETRITRAGVGEGPAYGPLVRRSHVIWEELEAETGEAALEGGVFAEDLPHLLFDLGQVVAGERLGAAEV
ncbi:MAG: FAD-dependent oxidoreductase, partial [Rhizorhabdus sp.]